MAENGNGKIMNGNVANAKVVGWSLLTVITVLSLFWGFVVAPQVYPMSSGTALERDVEHNRENVRDIKREIDNMNKKLDKILERVSEGN